MNDVQVLERLTSAYAIVEPPAPSPALAALIEAGGAVADDETPDAVVIPFASPRPRTRMRFLVAALVASFVALSGLAVAGALPDSIQRQVSSVVSHLGIDLPSPPPARGGDAPGPSNGSTDDHPATAPSTSSPTSSTAAGGAGAPGAVGRSTGDQSAGSTTTSTVPGVLGDVGDAGGVGGGTTDTTLPGGGGSSTGLPPVTLPPISLPPIGVPGLPLPPIKLPPITLPPIQLTLPPLLGL
jgi:hypothetical protein